MPRYADNSDYIARADQAWQRREDNEARARFATLDQQQEEIDNGQTTHNTKTNQG